ncbi:MAG: hypothetical protein U0176_18830 [Bacteroidia bacterium]
MQIGAMSLVESIDNALFVAKHDALTMSLELLPGLEDCEVSGVPE